MKINQLSVVKIRGLNAPGYYSDGSGLWLQVSATKTKSWIFRFTLNGRAREMGLGSLLTIGLSEARQLAKDCRVQLLNKVDPIQHRLGQRQEQRQSQTATFEYCAKTYIDTHKIDWKNAKHISQWTNTIKAYAEPIIGKLPINEVDTSAVMRVLTPIWTTKTETATRLRQRLESILGWATVMNYRNGDNPARWKDHLDNLLPTISKTKRLKHHPSLAWSEIGQFMQDLRCRDGTAAKALEFLILTACRSGEVRGAQWDEIKKDTWIITAERMKAGVEHQVPLPRQAVEVLNKLPRSNKYVFPGFNEQISDATLSAVLKRMNRTGFTVHGFRATFRMWCAETSASNFGRDVAEHALAHSLPNKVEAAYQRSTLLEKRSLLMQCWADFCDSTNTAAITQIRDAA